MAVDANLKSHMQVLNKLKAALWSSKSHINILKYSLLT